MNHYGRTAQRHWARWLPGRYARISDPDSFFSALGQEAARRIEDLAAELAGSNPAAENYLARAGRLTAARLQAEEIVLPELILLPPEPEAGEDPEPDQPAPAGRPMVIGRGHPLREQVNAEQEALLDDR
jgi:hypothetical protein